MKKKEKDMCNEHFLGGKKSNDYRSRLATRMVFKQLKQMGMAKVQEDLLSLPSTRSCGTVVESRGVCLRGGRETRLQCTFSTRVSQTYRNSE